METSSIQLHGLDLEYIVEGEGDDVMFIHGGSVSFRSWIPFIEELSKSFRVWAFSMPGAGKSSRLPRSWKFEDYATVIKDHTLQEKIRPHLIGHSLGGAIAVSLKAQYPELYGKLALLAPAGIPHKSGSSIWQVAKDQFKNFFFGDKYAKEDIRVNVRYHFLDMLKIGTLFKKIDARELLKRIDETVLIVWGRYDKILPIHLLDEFKRYLEKVKDYRINDGHNFINNNSEFLSKTLKVFFARQAQGKN